jgi:hypothetical protein
MRLNGWSLLPALVLLAAPGLAGAFTITGIVSGIVVPMIAVPNEEQVQSPIPMTGSATFDLFGDATGPTSFRMTAFDIAPSGPIEITISPTASLVASGVRLRMGNGFGAAGPGVPCDAPPFSPPICQQTTNEVVLQGDLAFTLPGGSGTVALGAQFLNLADAKIFALFADWGPITRGVVPFQGLTTLDLGLGENDPIVSVGGSFSIDFENPIFIPEPSTSLLLASGLAILARRGRGRRPAIPALRDRGPFAAPLGD